MPFGLGKKCILCKTRTRNEQIINNMIYCEICYELANLEHIIKNEGHVFVCKECSSKVELVRIRGSDGKWRAGFYCRTCLLDFEVNQVTHLIFQNKKEIVHEQITKLENATNKVLCQIGTLESEIGIFYKEMPKAESKIFVSHPEESGFEPIETKFKTKPIFNNFIKISIEVSKRTQMTKWNKKGRYNVYDDFGKGYSLTVSTSEHEKYLSSELLRIIREANFGPIPGTRFIHAHKHDESPTAEKAQNLVEELTNKIVNFLNDELKVV